MVRVSPQALDRQGGFHCRFQEVPFLKLVQGVSAHRAISLRRRGSNKGVCGCDCMCLHFEHHLTGEPAGPTDLGSCQEILSLSISRCQCQTPSWMMDAGASRSMKRVRPRTPAAGSADCGPVHQCTHSPIKRETAPGVFLTRPHSVKDLPGQISPLHKQWRWRGLPSRRRWTSRSRPGCDFFSEAGKQMESDNILAASHWAP